jgi:alpha-1,3/alpha-1,6-mannosyltransferase
MTKIVFIHLDWGIGGAEQLMLQLAMASKTYHHDGDANDDATTTDTPSTTPTTEIQLVTTRCDVDHCFAILRDRPCPFLQLYGTWIPSHIYGRGQVVLSTIRLLYLAMMVSKLPALRDADLIVTDVLPAPLFLLRYYTDAALLFYCHFPDRLLVRQREPEPPEKGTEGTKKGRRWLLRTIYRSVMDQLESMGIDLADTIVVNSNFTKAIARDSFPQLASRSLTVLYPALEGPEEPVVPTTTAQRQRQRQHGLLVSLNRFERKKNLRLLLDAVQYLRNTYPNANYLTQLQVIIAGGYDPRNMENVQHRIELGQLVVQYGLTEMVSFEHSISDARRTELLSIATAVIYTPDKEHFGIVPVEAMAAGTPVLACRSGGPMETIVDGVTGYLCDPTSAITSFGEAMRTLLENPDLVERMGQAGRHHAIATFGIKRFQTEWHKLVRETIATGRHRVVQKQRSTGSSYRLVHGLALLYEPIMCCVALWVLYRLLLYYGVLEDHEHLFQGLKRHLWKRSGKEEF